MNDSRCLICKYLGDHKNKTLNRDRIYRDRGNDLIVNLCYGHSWELFMFGQYKFLNRYRPNFMSFLGTETEAEFVSFIKGNKTASSDPWAA